METLCARLVEARQEASAGSVRVVLDVARGEDPGEAAGGSRREVLVVVPDDLATAFATEHPEWRPARPWAAFFAASRREVLEGLLETADASVELAEPPALADCRPPPEWMPAPWPPMTVRVERGAATPATGSVWRRRLGRLLPDLDEAQEIRVPLVLVGASLAASALAAILGPRGADVGEGLLLNGLSLLASIVTGIAACWIASLVAGIGFGYLRTAIVKLAAVFTVPTAIDQLLSSLLGGSILGLLFALTAYCWLLAWLFDLDLVEIGVIAVMLVLLRLFMVGILRTAVGA